MPYVPLPVSVSSNLDDLIRGTIDPALNEIHLLLTIVDPDQGPKGSLQRSIAILLMAATDGAAQWFCPGKMQNGDRFKKFVTDFFPFDGVQTPKDEVAEFLWHGTRNALMHRFGLHTSGVLRKFDRMFTSTDADIERLERYPTRPYTDPFFVQDDKRTVVLVEGFYWELRQAIVKALDTPDKFTAVEAWIKSGSWDHSAR